jgi:Spy/CpxP family protein refolding chaperone
MKNRSLIFSAALLLIVVAPVPFAYAQHMRHRGLAEGPGGMHGHGGPGDIGALMMLGHLEHAREALGLSDQQVSDIKSIFKDLHAQNAAYRDQLHGTMLSVAQALLANPNDVAGAQALLDKQEAAEHTMKANALIAASKALNVLTPEQRTKLSTHLQERADHFRQK